MLAAASWPLGLWRPVLPFMTLCRPCADLTDRLQIPGLRPAGPNRERLETAAGATKNKHAKLHGRRPSRQISSHSLQVTSGRQDRYPIRSPSRSNSKSRRNTFKINQESIPNPCKFVKIQTESMKNPLEIAAESIQNPHGTNAKSKATFAYPSRAFH